MHIEHAVTLAVDILLDRVSHNKAPYVEKAAVFFKLLSTVYHDSVEETLGKRMADFINREYLNITSLDALCEEFHYSKNHIINIFKDEFGMTPVEYINDVKLKKAMYLLEVTSSSAETVARESGFNYYSHFYRLFVRKNQMSPLQWRNKIKLLPYYK